MQFDKQKVQKGGNTGIKVVSNKVFFRTWREKKDLFRAKGMKICLIPTKGECRLHDARKPIKRYIYLYEERYITGR